MPHLVMILSSDDGEKRDDPVWHLNYGRDAERTFCEGEAFGIGESGCDYKTKVTKRGGITCPECLKMIKEIKAIRL